MNRPRIIIAGTQSGAGKTTVTLALMAAYRKAGLKVQGFKVGPDYIDPGYHKAATGVPSHNLDSWLLSRETLLSLFEQKSEPSELSVIEGVMGLYDGLGVKDDTASTAQIAKLLHAPVLLVLDARSLSRSAAAMVLGYRSFDPKVHIAGVILNKVGSPRHLDLLREAIETYSGVPVLGAIPRDKRVQIPERHLGLMTSEENPELRKCIEGLSELALSFDLKKVRDIAERAPDIPYTSSSRRPVIEKVNIGVALDRAFSFYYQANLDLLKDLGAEMIPFSPLESPKIPESIGALYFGGGYPEIYAKELVENTSLKNQINDLIRSGMPVYAECGGLMYLSESIETLKGNSYAMVGAVPGKIRMTEKLQNFGYKGGIAVQDTILCPKGSSVRGHEFHYSLRENGDQPILENGHTPYHLPDRKTGTDIPEGFCSESLLASYLHLHFLTDPGWAQSFVEKAVKFSRKNLRDAARLISIFGLLILLFEKMAFAMHISDGILPLRWAGFWTLISAPFVYWGLRDLRKKISIIPYIKPLLGMVSAVVFLISCMPVPVPTAGTCSHPCGTGFSALLIGPPLSILVTTVALFIQALFLAHGGLTTWGADIVSMGVAGSLAGYSAFKLLRKWNISEFASAFCAGLAADWATYSVTSLELALALHGKQPVTKMFFTVLIAFIPTQLPLGILEGFMTAWGYRFLLNRRPDMLKTLGILEHGESVKIQ